MKNRNVQKQNTFYKNETHLTHVRSSIMQKNVFRQELFFVCIAQIIRKITRHAFHQNVCTRDL